MVTDGNNQQANSPLQCTGTSWSASATKAQERLVDTLAIASSTMTRLAGDKSSLTIPRSLQITLTPCARCFTTVTYRIISVVT